MTGWRFGVGVPLKTILRNDNRRAPRQACDTTAWIRPEGSFKIHECRVFDTSKLGVRLAIADACRIPDRFTLFSDQNRAGRPGRVKWRRGTQVGAEFFTANSSSTSRSTADAARAAKPRQAESESLMPTPSLHAQRLQPAVGELNADAREVVAEISADKAKTTANCQITDLGEQLERADQKKNNEKRMDLSLLQKRLGPEHIALIHALKDIDPESPHGRELASIIESLDE